MSIFGSFFPSSPKKVTQPVVQEVKVDKNKDNKAIKATELKTVNNSVEPKVHSGNMMVYTPALYAANKIVQFNVGQKLFAGGLGYALFAKETAGTTLTTVGAYSKAVGSYEAAQAAVYMTGLGTVANALVAGTVAYGVAKGAGFLYNKFVAKNEKDKINVSISNLASKAFSFFTSPVAAAAA